MQFISTLLFITAVFDITFAVIIYLKARKKENTLAKYYLLLFTAVGMWELFMWISFFINLGDQINSIIDQLTVFTAILSAFFFLVFVWILIQRSVFSNLLFKGLGVIVTIFFILAFVPRTFVLGREYYSEVAYDFHLMPGPLMLYAYGFAFFIFILLLILLLRGFKYIDSPLTKVRTKIVGYSIIFTYFLNGISSIFFPWYINFILKQHHLTASKWFIVQQSISVISLTLVSFAVAYAITRYRFMNIKVEIGQHLLYAIVIILICTSYIAVALLLSSYIPILFFLLLGLLLTFVYCRYIDRYLRSFLDSFFFLKKIDTSKNFRFDGDDTIDSTREIRKWINQIEDDLEQNGFHLRNTYIYQRQHNRYIDYNETDLKRKHVWSLSDDVSLLNSHSKQLIFSNGDSFTFGRKGEKDFDIVCQVQYKGFLYAILLLHVKKNHWDKLVLAAIIQENAYSCYGVVQAYESIEGVRRTAKEMIYSQNR